MSAKGSHYSLRRERLVAGENNRYWFLQVDRSTLIDSPVEWASRSQRGLGTGPRWKPFWQRRAVVAGPHDIPHSPINKSQSRVTSYFLRFVEPSSFLRGSILLGRGLVQRRGGARHRSILRVSTAVLPTGRNAHQLPFSLNLYPRPVVIIMLWKIHRTRFIRMMFVAAY